MFTKTICFVRDPYHEIRLILSDARFLGFLKRSGKFGQCAKSYPTRTNACDYDEDADFLDTFKVTVAHEALRLDKVLIAKSSV